MPERDGPDLSHVREALRRHDERAQDEPEEPTPEPDERERDDDDDDADED
jgi:hypothetical protein